ncbi:MAG: glycosyltransferase [Pseudomonadota bacterium]
MRVEFGSKGSGPVNWPRISIVTPAYRAARTLEATLRSVFDQGYPELEFILMDGGCDDETAEIAHQYGEHITEWVRGPDDGQYHAIADGFGRAKGDVFFWLNADDVLLPGALWAVGEIFATFTKVAWLTTLRPAQINARGGLMDVGHAKGFAKAAFLDGFYLGGSSPAARWIQQESTFFRASLWAAAGPALTRYALAGDFALWCEMYRHAELHGCTHPLGAFRVLSGQRSEAIDIYTSEAHQALTDLRTDLGWRPNVLRLAGQAASRSGALPFRSTRAFGYEGSRLTDGDPKSANGVWRCERYRFIP